MQTSRYELVKYNSTFAHLMNDHHTVIFPWARLAGLRISETSCHVLHTDGSSFEIDEASFHRLYGAYEIWAENPKALKEFALDLPG